MSFWSSSGFWLGVLLSGGLGFLLGTPSLHQWYDNYHASSATTTLSSFSTTNTLDTSASSSSSSSSSAQISCSSLSSTLSPDLLTFLSSPSVDDALNFAAPITPVTSFLSSQITQVVAACWGSKNQWIYNVLLHSYLLTNDRFSVIHKALLDKDDVNLRYAAAVAVQMTPRRYLDAAPVARDEFMKLLLDYCLMEEEDDILAARSFLAVKHLLSPRHTLHVVLLLDTMNARNALTWLLKLHGDVIEQKQLDNLIRRNIEQYKQKLTRDQSQSSSPATNDDTSIDSSTHAHSALKDDYAPLSPLYVSRLRNVDLSALFKRIEPMLSSHFVRVAARDVSPLRNYAELDIPDYAPMIIGTIHDVKQTIMAQMQIKNDKGQVDEIHSKTL